MNSSSIINKDNINTKDINIKEYSDDKTDSFQENNILYIKTDTENNANFLIINK